MVERWMVYKIDHIDRNKHNNSISNLRLVTPSENEKNRDSGLGLPMNTKENIASLYEHSDMTMREVASLYGISKGRVHQIISEIRKHRIMPRQCCSSTNS